MYKIFLTVRNRLSMTMKCLTALKKHSALEHKIYVYDNCTNFKIKEHFMLFSLLYENKSISHVAFNTEDSTYNCFSKAVASNQFGFLHEMDPYKDRIDFIVFLDNDIIVTPNWDLTLLNAWKDVNKNKYNNIKIIGQYPGGIKDKIDLPGKSFGGFPGIIGKLGGSALWSVKNNFFNDVGFLDIRNTYGINKKHDSEYWKLLNKSSNGSRYILGLKTKLGIHCGLMSGSVCNVLSQKTNLTKTEKEDIIKFDNQEEYIDKLSFDEFYDVILSEKTLETDW